VAGSRVELGEWVFEFPADTPALAGAVVCALDPPAGAVASGAPASRYLAGAWSQASGAEGQVGAVDGRGIHPATARLTRKSRGGAAWRLFALDARGHPVSQAPVIIREGQVEFLLGPQFGAFWYGLEASEAGKSAGRR